MKRIATILLSTLFVAPAAVLLAQSPAPLPDPEETFSPRPKIATLVLQSNGSPLQESR